MNTTSTAVATRRNGEPERLVVLTRPIPVAQSGEELLRLSRVGVNFLDIYQARGQYPVPPGTVLGFEGVGTAADGKRYAVINHPGAYAQHIAVPREKLIPVPDDISDDAAMVLFQGITAQYLITATHPVRPGERVLIYAAAGGVGSILMQAVKAAGGLPIGMVSSEVKARDLRQRGFNVLVGDGSDAQLVRRATGDDVDVVFDANGAATWELSLASVATRGHIVLYGAADGAYASTISVPALQAKSLTLSTPSVFAYVADPAELALRAQAVFAWLREGVVTLPPMRAFPLEQAIEAHALLESRAVIGKIVLTP